MKKHYPEHTKTPFNFEPGLAYDKRLPTYKSYLLQKQQALQAKQDSGASAREILLEYTLAVDALIEDLFGHAVALFRNQCHSKPFKVVVLALGSYGRKELAPQSDLDLLFLYPDQVQTKALDIFKETMSREVLYPLWDLKLRVGQASRSVSECKEDAMNDFFTLNAILDLRYICGSRRLYMQFSEQFFYFVKKLNKEAYLEKSLKACANRYEKYGNSVYVQEPHIKEGMGGLREYQNIIWLSAVFFGTLSIKVLRKHSILSRIEYDQLEQSHAFLLRVRNALHFFSKRKNDILFLDQQPEIALLVGYKEKDVFKRVEAFMKDFYKNAEVLYKCLQRFENYIRHHLVRPDMLEKLHRAFKNTRAFDGIILGADNVIEAKHRWIFQQDPIRVLRVLGYLEKYDASLSPHLENKITGTIHKLDHQIWLKREAQDAFLAMLTHKGHVYTVLAKMHDLNLLSLLVPELDPLKCLVQHEHFHRYTADIHTLNCMKELDYVFSKKDVIYALYHDALQSCPEPEILYLILLLHDIGKSKGIEGHAHKSVELSGPVLDRLLVDKEAKDAIFFVIENHLEMVRFWQRYDVEDPKTIELFAEFIENEKQLKYLFVHSFCDAKATAPDLWNQHKNTLHLQLYKNTLQYLRNPDSLINQRREKKQILLKELLQKPPEGVVLEAIEHHFKTTPVRYFNFIKKESIANHLKMINTLFKQQKTYLKPIIDWDPTENKNVFKVSVIFWDTPGLIYQICGSLNAAGFNILTSRAYTRKDNVVIDVFYVEELLTTHSDLLQSQERFGSYLEDKLSGKIKLEPLIIRQADKRRHIDLEHKKLQLETTLSTEVRAHYSSALKVTILEIEGRDRLGLIFSIARALFRAHYNIDFARIHTENGAVRDTFHIRSLKNPTPPSKEDLKCLEKAVCEAIKHPFTKPNV